jgi:hypothetical protein
MYTVVLAPASKLSILFALRPDFIYLELEEDVGENCIIYKIKEKAEDEKNGRYTGSTVMVILSNELIKKIEEILAGGNNN